MTTSPQITFTPSDFVGAVKQGLGELHNYLSTTPVPEIDVAVCQAHLERLFYLIGAAAPSAPAASPASSAEGKQPGLAA